MIRRLIFILTAAAFARILLLPLNPVNDGLQRLSLLGAMGVAWVGVLVLSWGYRWVRVVLLAVPVLMAVPFLLPGRSVNRAGLREDYVRRMAGFEGTRYVWGGESSRGIDCSGLPRRALRDALLSEGIRRGNGAALRAWVEQWWFDASAKALAAGYRDYTTPLQVRGKLRMMDFSALSPGDLAVTKDGVHVLAYVGGGKWIQADPGAGKVVTLDPRTSESGWFDSPVSLHRWRVLSRDGE